MKKVEWKSAAGNAMVAEISTKCWIDSNTFGVELENMKDERRAEYAASGSIDLCKMIDINVTKDGAKFDSARREPSVLSDNSHTRPEIKKLIDAGAYAMIGSKVLVKKDVYNEIVAAIKLEQENPANISDLAKIHLAWLDETKDEREAKEEKRIADIAKQDSHKHGAGWCEKCGSYCFGDCSAN